MHKYLIIWHSKRGSVFYLKCSIFLNSVITVYKKLIQDILFYAMNAMHAKSVIPDIEEVRALSLVVLMATSELLVLSVVVRSLRVASSVVLSKVSAAML